ncbi:ECF RNA polymerase sigma factor SigK [Nocardioides psychrotolerans]|uniref:RNA polymerase sigma-70 factor, ECF subfamily n=1 Tax=Nocardioides psychrotolerans TaxID=1005945 RepID=A0A1I3J7W0_9ACTN|nr:ECF RNA polymerase sigma factor SigK [Nocardioides psychrotolerans]SFI56269.1 RNA polymerase sigma-70 factor, ECF subfamily [Nocardioides psychrotolerans]
MPRRTETTVTAGPTALLVATGQGESDAFAALYDETAPRVHGLAVRILRDQHQAEEVTQEIFLQVWQSAAQFDPSRGSAMTWLMTLAHRRAVDRVRASESSRRRDTADVGLDVRTAYDETAAAVHTSLEGQRVHAALATLSPGQRRAIELAYFGGLTHTEVSRLLQIPLGTAKTRIRDGLRRLHDLLASAAEPA